MGIKLSELDNGDNIVLIISNKDNSIQMPATLKSIVRDDLALITIEYDSTKRLNFDNVKVDMEYALNEASPILWRDVRIHYYKSDYVLQTTRDGAKHNRRGCLRVGVSTLARMRMACKVSEQVMIRDISLLGFSITDRKKELGLSVGDTLSVDFEDLGHVLNLAGRVVRTEEHEDMIIYGLEITNLCKDLSSYISRKQRH